MREYFLTTDRIGFSVWTEEDRDLALSLWGSPDVTRLICASGRFTRQEVFDRLALEADNYRRYSVQYFPIFARGDGDLIGCCGLRLVWIYTVFAANPSMKLLYLSYPLSWVLTTCAQYICYFSVRKKAFAQNEAEYAAKAALQS